MCPSGSEGQTCKKGKQCRIPFRFLLAEKWKKIIDNICPPESARAVARAEPVRWEKFCRISFRFLLAEKWGKNVLIIYAPRECPSGSEG